MNSSRRPFVQSLLSAQSSPLLTDSTQSLIMTSEPSIELGIVEAPNNGHVFGTYLFVLCRVVVLFWRFFGIECMDCPLLLKGLSFFGVSMISLYVHTCCNKVEYY